MYDLTDTLEYTEQITRHQCVQRDEDVHVEALESSKQRLPMGIQELW
jgi:hypothetical protein